MKNTLSWILALMLLLGATLYWLTPVSPAPAPKVAARTASPPISKPAASKPAAPKTAARRRDSSLGEFDVQQMKETEARINKTMAKLAKVMTPEIRAKMLDAHMKSLEPRYRALFDSWGLDSSTGDQVLSVIREREFQRNERFQKLQEKGTPAVKEYTKDRQREDGWAEVQLTALVGTDHVAEISQLESQAQAEAMAKIQETLRNRPKENG